MCTCDFINARHAPDCETRIGSKKPSFEPSEDWKEGYEKGLQDGKMIGFVDASIQIRGY